MKTHEIIELQRKTGLHPADEGGCGRVSSRSEWSAAVWQLDLADPERSPAEGKMVWDPGIAEEVTAGLKALAWSLFVARGRNAPLRPSAARHLGYTLQYLGKWMRYRQHTRFSALNALALQVYRDDLTIYFASDDGPDGPDVDVTPQTIAAYLRPIEYLDEQSRHLAKRGFAPIPNAPFGLSSAWEVALDIVPQVEAFAPVIPDEVLLPVVREAHLWLDERADDVIRLQQVFISQLGTDRYRGSVLGMVTRDLRRFRFTSSVEGEPAWHPPFVNFLDRGTRRPARSAEREAVDGPAFPVEGAQPASDDPLPGAGRPIQTRFDFDDVGNEEEDGLDDPEVEADDSKGRRRKVHYGTDRVRRLISHLVAACAIVIRFQTGIRHGEIFTFEAGLGENGMPLCVEREQSLSGAYEMFFAKGRLSKGEDEPVEARWLLAGRLYDDPAVPDAVKALIVLNRVAEPWRQFASRADAKKALMVQPGHSGLTHRPERVWPMASARLATLMKRFVWDNVDLSHLDANDERLAEYVRTGGTCLKSRQWRKTWANWMIRVDKRLLPAISQQFHHRSVLLTDEAYIGKDAMQLGIVESAAMQRAVQYMRRAMAGEDHVGGGMKKVIESQLDELRQRIAGMSGVAQEHEIRTWLLDRDIRIWFSPHGKCFVGLMPSDARCHEVAQTVDFANQAPSFANRTPKLCSGCPCFAVDEDDLPFWTERYLENRRIWKEAVERGLEVNYTVADERWQQSGKVLQSLGVDVAELSREMVHASNH